MAEAPAFEMTPELDREIERAAGVLREARYVLALTGAGLSVESGIPPFRGEGGLRTKYGVLPGPTRATRPWPGSRRSASSSA